MPGDGRIRMEMPVLTLQAGRDRVALMSPGRALTPGLSLASLLVVATLTASATWAGSTQAAVTLGSDLATEPTIGLGCPTGTGRGCLFVTDVLPGRELVSPYDGVILRWRVRLGDGTEPQSIRIRVLRQFDPDQYTAILSSGLEDVPSGAGTYTFPAQLPYQER